MEIMRSGKTDTSIIRYYFSENGTITSSNV